MNILRFQPNVPIQVALQSSQGVVVEGRYGNRVMFSLVDGRVMYVPPIVAAKIEAEGIPAGERFELCKAQIKNGHGRSVEWALRRLDPEEQLVDVAPDEPNSETQLEHDLRVSAETRRSCSSCVSGAGVLGAMSTSCSSGSSRLSAHSTDRP